jgi:signal transduction histidine kinase
MDSHETSVYHAVVTAGAVIGFIIAYFVLSVFQHQRKRVQAQRLYFSGEINLLEKDRSRMSNDLHDSAAPLLSAAKTHINELTAPTEKDQFHVEKANERLDQLMKHLREVSINLSHTSLIRKGLEFTMQSFFGEVIQPFGIQVEFTYELNSTVAPETGIHLLRIVQEITHNVLKHARATAFVVHFKEKRQKLFVLCKDNGIGFKPEKLNGSREGLGLGTIQSRTELLNGKLRFTSKPQHGTEYFFEFPIHASGPKD